MVQNIPKDGFEFLMHEHIKVMRSSSVRSCADRAVVLDSYELLEKELVESIITAKIDDLEREFVFVGTAITHDEEETQPTGRVLAFQVSPTGEYKLIDAFDVPGVVYCIKPFMGSIIAAVEGSVSQLLYKVIND